MPNPPQRVIRAALTLIATAATALALAVPATAAPPGSVQTPQVLPAATGAAASGAMRISAGFSFVVVLDTKGRAWSWGYNYVGQLGLGTVGDQAATPREVVPGEATGVRFTAVSAGDNFALALGADGHVYSWGGNDSGQLGNGTYTDSPTPVRVLDGEATGVRFVAISAGHRHSLALGNDGRVYAWGSGWSGELGNGKTGSSASPVQVATGAAKAVKFAAISAGGEWSLALGNDGHLYSWGGNDSGQLGDGTTTDRSTPVRVLDGAAKGARLTAIDAFDSEAMVLASDGQLYMLGWYTSNKLSRYKAQPKGVKFTAIAGGTYNNAVVDTGGRVYYWGGDPGGFDVVYKPTKFAPGAMKSATPVQIAAGRAFIVVLASDDHLYAWGENDGRLGIGKNKRADPMGKPAAVKDAAIPLKGSAKAAGASTAGSGKTSSAKALTSAKPKVTGTAAVGKKLTAKVKKAKWTAGATLTVQWYANGTKIAKATKAKLKLTSALAGKKITVKVTGVKKGFAAKTVTSKPITVKK